ncbi:MAG: hypothetical protein PW735_05510 [Acidobacteriaceae bacterium]|nr:hypothetical protein [Acidobacteriaceae bacterium]
MKPRLAALFFLLAAALALPAHAIEIRVSAKALERTLAQQLFNTPDGRYYIKGSADHPCFVYARDPRVRFKDDRIIIHVSTKSRLGTGAFGSCIGVGLTTDADVSVIPQAEGESIGFRDARVDDLSSSRELNFLLVPFLTHKLPQQMKINAAELIRKLLAESGTVTGYNVRLDNLKIHSMMVENGSLVVDFDGDLSVD